MVELHALFPGTFDPPTLGHLDLLERAARLFPRVTVAIAEHPTKTPLLRVDERIELLQECTREEANVVVVRFEGLTVQACQKFGCNLILRGLRNGGDFEYEAPMAGTNRSLAPDLDTAFLATSPALSHVSSTLVRQIARMGGDVSSLVPEPVARALRARLEE